MPDLDLGKQIGPLPLGAWIVVVGAGVGIALYSRNSNAAPTVVEDTSMDEGVGEGPGWVAVPPPPYGPNAPEPATNEEWGRNAINFLISMGYNSSSADSAIRKYLAAEKLSVTEYALITEALRKLGAPPVPLPPGPGTPTTNTTVNWSTKTDVSGYSRTWFGNAYVATTRVSWVDSRGHSMPPRGFVETAIDGEMIRRTRLLNGVAVRTFVVSRKSPFRDKVFVITAKFLPNTGTSEKPSAASPHTARILNKN